MLAEVSENHTYKESRNLGGCRITNLVQTISQEFLEHCPENLFIQSRRIGLKIFSGVPKDFPSVTPNREILLMLNDKLQDFGSHHEDKPNSRAASDEAHEKLHFDFEHFSYESASTTSFYQWIGCYIGNESEAGLDEEQAALVVDDASRRRV